VNHAPERASRGGSVCPWPRPGARARLNELAQEIFPPDQQTPQALGALQKAEIEKWWPIIKAANIKAE